MDSVARYAGTAQSVTPPSGASWSNPENATGSSGAIDSRASASIDKNDVSETLLLTNYGFANDIPLNTNIFGVEVRVHRSGTGSNIYDNEIQLRYEGSPIGTVKAGSSVWPGVSSRSTAFYGGASDDWGAALTPEMVRDSSFGVGISAENRDSSQSRNAHIYWVEITVFYGDLSSPRQWFTDFSEYPVDTELSEHDWSKPWAQGPQAMVRVEDGESLVHVTNPGSGARTAWTWGAVGSLTVADYPIQVRAEISFAAITQSNELQAHISGDSGGENAYIATRVAPTRRIVKYSNGASSDLVTASFSQTIGTRYHLILEIDSSGVRHKIWPADSSEPAGWLLSDPDTELTSGGVGLGAATADTDFRCYWFSVGTVGNPAPTEPIQPDPPTGLSLQSTGPNSIAVTWNEPS